MTSPARHILVIKLGALGDFIQALGPMAAIRAHHAGQRITLLTTKPFEALARASGYFDDIILDARPRWHDVRGWMALRSTLNAGKFSRVYDLQNNDRTGFYLKLFSPHPEWVGAAAGASHRNTSPQRTAGKAFDGHVQTLALAGITNVRTDRLDWIKWQNDFSHIKKPYVLIVPGGSPQHPRKRWPANHYAALGQRLEQAGYGSVIIGSAEESALAQKISDAIPSSLNLAGKTALFDLPQLARKAAGAIGNDTGPMHLIAPTGCPSIILFSHKSDPRRHAPMGNNVITIQQQNLDDLDTDDVWQAFCDQQSIE